VNRNDNIETTIHIGYSLVCTQPDEFVLNYLLRRVNPCLSHIFKGKCGITMNCPIVYPFLESHLALFVAKVIKILLLAHIFVTKSNENNYFLYKHRN
jgi:hypothetical protein